MQLNETVPVFKPITPFHIREQLWELINGPGSVRGRVSTLLTTSRSPYRLREKMYGIASARELTLEESEEVSVQTVSRALQLKMEKEKRTNPFHVSIICDGNRRHEKEHGMEKGTGHKAGARQVLSVLVPLIAQIPEVGMCSLYLLSCSNVQHRGEEELKNIYAIIEDTFPHLMQLAERHQLRYVHAGERNVFPENVQKILSRLELGTSNNQGPTINLCLNYDTSLEQGYAMKKILESHTPAELANMTPQDLSRALTQAKWVPAVDAVIRTGGDQRFSGFLGNRPEDANASLHVETAYLPQLDQKRFLGHLMEFATGQRRMGK